MTTMVKVTGLTVETARACLQAALGYLNTMDNQRNFSLTVTPNYYFVAQEYDEETDDLEEAAKQELYSFSLNKNGKVE